MRDFFIVLFIVLLMFLAVAVPAYGWCLGSVDGFAWTLGGIAADGWIVFAIVKDRHR